MTDFSELYRKYAPDVLRFSVYLCGDRDEAEDITAETFARAWASPAPIRTATVKGYLFTIARNLFLQGLRKKARHVALDDDVPDTSTSPESQVEHASELDAVLERLQHLAEIDRAALVMRAVDELPYDEIARTLGISVAAARVKVHRARLALADIRRL
jgi:RNA polymerase sigma-70 factor (ECF subfamily)